MQPLLAVSLLIVLLVLSCASSAQPLDFSGLVGGDPLFVYDVPVANALYAFIHSSPVVEAVLRNGELSVYLFCGLLVPIMKTRSDKHIMNQPGYTAAVIGKYNQYYQNFRNQKTTQKSRRPAKSSSNSKGPTGNDHREVLSPESFGDTAQLIGLAKSLLSNKYLVAFGFQHLAIQILIAVYPAKDSGYYAYATNIFKWAMPLAILVPYMLGISFGKYVWELRSEKPSAFLSMSFAFFFHLLRRAVRDLFVTPANFYSRTTFFLILSIVSLLYLDVLDRSIAKIDSYKELYPEDISLDSSLAHLKKTKSRVIMSTMFVAGTILFLNLMQHIKDGFTFFSFFTTTMKYDFMFSVPLTIIFLGKQLNKMGSSVSIVDSMLAGPFTSLLIYVCAVVALGFNKVPL